MFEKKLPFCPSCGYNKKSGLLTGSHFYVYTCSGCGHDYCYKCSGSNDGKKCPRCGNSSKKTKGIVYLLK
jgi:hypothetical protein